MNRPPYRSRSPIKCCGPYTGAGDPKVKAEQWDEIGKDLYDAGYNQISLYLILPTPMRFLPVPMTTAWKNHIDVMVDRLGFWRITPKIKFVDQYHEDITGDPFSRLSVEQLYSSWDGKNFSWLKWDEPTPRHYTNFRATNQLGRDIMKYVQTVVDSCAKAKEKYIDFRVAIAWANETMALFSGSGGHPVKTRGDRDEVLYWVQGLFHKAGFINNKNMLVDVDYLAYRDSIRNIDYGIMAEVSQDLAEKGQRLEIHGIKTLDDIQKYVKAGVVPRACLFSTDGDLRMEGDYVGLGHSPFHVDLKLDCKPGEPFFPANFMAFWRRYFPPYRTYIK